MAWLGSRLFAAVGKHGRRLASLQHHWLMPPFTSAVPSQFTEQVAPKVLH
jgi:hypothetical protein